MRVPLHILRILFAFLALIPSSWGADQVALVIGNSLYDASLPPGEGPNLVNPGRDATAFTDRNLLFRPARPRVTGRRGMVGVQGAEGSFSFRLGVI
jgi:hypothetical protein